MSGADRPAPAAGGWGRRFRRLWPALAAAGLVIFAASVLGVSRLEEEDTFCASCHTAPEVEYRNRALRAVAQGLGGQDLASAHYNLVESAPRCIDCHRGDAGPIHRATTLTLGARDALIFILGRADPTLEKNHTEVPGLLTAGCTKCHTPTLLVAGFENHFHNKLPEAFVAWKTGSPLTAPPDDPQVDTTQLKSYAVTILCVDCHRAHVTVDGAELTQYIDVVNTVYPVCVDCHRQTEHGPLDLVRPGSYSGSP